jgi:hypothetical protein
VHHDLGFVVDLGGLDAAANPLGIPLSGLPAAVVTRGYHLAAMPGNRMRTLVDWTADALLGRQTVQLGPTRRRRREFITLVGTSFPRVGLRFIPSGFPEKTSTQLRRPPDHEALASGACQKRAAILPSRAMMKSVPA